MPARWYEAVLILIPKRRQNDSKQLLRNNTSTRSGIKFFLFTKTRDTENRR